MKIQFLKKFSITVEQDGKEVDIAKAIFSPGEAFITKDKDGNYFLQFVNSYQCDQVVDICDVLNYDTQREDCFSGVDTVIPVTKDKGKHIIFLIAWNYNPARLRLKINDTPLHKIEFFEF